MPGAPGAGVGHDAGLGIAVQRHGAARAEDLLVASIDSMTTRGASGLTLERHWLTMGTLEAADGMLLFGISTVYIFTVMQLYWLMLSELVMTRRLP